MTLALAQIFHAFSARSQRRSVTARPFTNGWLWAAVAACVLLQLAAVYWPFLQAILNTAALTAADWALVAGCSVAPIVVIELAKLARAARGRGRHEQRP
jgi:Ca2+-transporting ATPase